MGRLNSLFRGHLPRTLPPGLGLLELRSPPASAVWADERCRVVELTLGPTRPGDLDGPPVGAWALVENGQCSNRVLSGAACEAYAVHVAEGTLVLRATGLTRDVVEPIVLDVPL